MYMPQYAVETAILWIFYTAGLWCHSRLPFFAFVKMLSYGFKQRHADLVKHVVVFVF